jgi:spore coat polysaccharide biosynthesis predicted glycosyltransferase SpsG
MRFIFRADASKEIGSGHVMRCSVLAEEAISRGYETIFVGTISDLDWVSARILNLGFSSLIEKEEDFVVNPETDILILDSYEISELSPFISPTNWRYILSISDEITPEYKANATLVPSLQINSNASSTTRVLSGPDFILVRSGIMKSRKVESESGPLRVMIVGGGSDPFKFVKEISGVISNLGLHLELHCFTDDELPESESVVVFRHSIGPDFDKWAKEVDLVLSTASTTCLEFIGMEVPIGVVCAVNNQQNYYNQLGKLGYVSQIGILERSGKWIFNLSELVDLLSDAGKRTQLRNATKGLIDLKGASRVIDFLEVVNQ